ncbi:hypothetical protein BKA81DRAFT_428165 [Phyllosticta paracitricarpa]|uniref:Uncharacterized protein n=2 Tax=Phyllosticta TaxID=121621 RepID=A0ABR1LBZ0_9PEZI
MPTLVRRGSNRPAATPHRTSSSPREKKRRFYAPSHSQDDYFSDWRSDEFDGQKNDEDFVAAAAAATAKNEEDKASPMPPLSPTSLVPQAIMSPGRYHNPFPPDDFALAGLTNSLQAINTARARVQQARQDHDAAEAALRSTVAGLIKAQDTANATDREANNLKNAQAEIARICEQAATVEALRHIAEQNRLDLAGVSEAVSLANDDVRLMGESRADAAQKLELEKRSLHRATLDLEQKEAALARAASMDSLQALADALVAYLEKERGASL